MDDIYEGCGDCILRELPRCDIVSCESIEELQKEHDAKVRADAISEISREMRLLYGNEYEKKIREDAIEEFKKYLLSHKKLIREFETNHVYEAVKIEFITDTYMEQLKERQNEDII